MNIHQIGALPKSGNRFPSPYLIHFVMSGASCGEFVCPTSRFCRQASEEIDLLSSNCVPCSQVLVVAFVQLKLRLFLASLAQPSQAIRTTLVHREAATLDRAVGHCSYKLRRKVRNLPQRAFPRKRGYLIFCTAQYSVKGLMPEFYM